MGFYVQEKTTIDFKKTGVEGIKIEDPELAKKFRQKSIEIAYTGIEIVHGIAQLRLINETRVIHYLFVPEDKLAWFYDNKQDRFVSFSTDNGIKHAIRCFLALDTLRVITIFTHSEPRNGSNFCFNGKCQEVPSVKVRFYHNDTTYDVALYCEKHISSVLREVNQAIVDKIKEDTWTRSYEIFFNESLKGDK